MRLPLFDSLKGFAILMVVYTHVLQYVGVGNYLVNPFFEFTYAFHMPLFMTISGYFAASTLRLGWKELLHKKAVNLLLPCLTAGIVILLVNRTLHWDPRHAGLSYPIFNLWYLKCLFACYVIGKLSLQVTRQRVTWAIVLSLVFSLFLPTPFHIAFMLPFFWAGYVWRRHPDWIARRANLILAVSVIVFLCLWPFWDGYQTVYIHPLRLFHYRTGSWEGANWVAHLLRLGIGAAGTAATIALFTIIYQRQRSLPLLERVGRHTLELYTLHFFLIDTRLLHLAAMPYIRWAYELIYCPLLTAIVLTICRMTITVCNQSKCLRLLLFGKTGN